MIIEMCIRDRNIVKSAVALYGKLLSQGYKTEDIQLLTAYKKGDLGSIAINNAIPKVANKNYGSSEYMKVGDVVSYEGDMVCLLYTSRCV